MVRPMATASDEGMTLFENEPELLVAAVWHVAAKLYQDRETQMEFVNGYITARRHRDEYRSEKNPTTRSRQLMEKKNNAPET